MNLQDIRNLIGQGDTSNALKALVGLAQEGAGRNRRLRDDLLILSNRFEELRRKETIGILEQEDVVREHAQVNEALLNLISEMEARPTHKEPAKIKRAAYSTKLSKEWRVGLYVLGAAALGLVIYFVLKQDHGPDFPPAHKSEIRPNPAMVYIEGGVYEMGNPHGAPDEKPHQVSINSFYMDKYEVSNAEYAQFMNKNKAANPAWLNFEDNYAKEQCRIYRSDGQYHVEPGFEKHPVVYVSWAGALAFAQYYGLRLPTEAEWEYAARGGKQGIGYQYIYAGSNQLDSVGWYNRNARLIIRPIGQKKPNGLGLYDLSGNVFEWCTDYYDKEYYFYGPKGNPQGPDSSSTKVVRGGNVFLPDSLCRSTNRGLWNPASHNAGIGFRCVKDK
jgi:formylglycine-generating enzyme required for sulfatase activity